MIKEMSPQEFVERRDAGTDMTLLDVREIGRCSLRRSVRIAAYSHGTGRDRLGELDPTKETVVICRSGGEAWRLRGFSRERLRIGLQSQRRHSQMVQI